jgi:hypothetical protein
MPGQTHHHPVVVMCDLDSAQHVLTVEQSTYRGR